MDNKMLRQTVLHRVFPFLDWRDSLRPSSVKSDALAGLTVALVLIPQSMAYAQLAGLPAYYGLYASLLPPMVAALFGSSRQLATGPVAVVSLLTAVALEPLARAGSEGYIAYAVLLAVMVGVLQFLLGIFKLGELVNLLSHPVVNGFTNAAALIIASSQLAKLFGVYVDTADSHYATIVQVVDAAIHHLHWPTFLMGLAAFAIMYVLRVLYPHSPNVLAAVVATTLISWLTGYEHRVEVPLSALKAPALQETMETYQRITRERYDLMDKRGHYSRQHTLARSSQSPTDALAARHQTELVELQLRQLQYQATALKQRIRKTLLQGVTYAPQGASGFYLLGKLPPEARADGRIWRIALPTGTFSLAAIPLTSGGEVIGAIPRGLPAPILPQIDFKAVRSLLPFAGIIALLGFMEAISVARAAAAKTGQRIDPNQELVGQGLANLAGALTHGYPVSGSFSRTAVNLKAGAVSGISSIVTTLVVGLVLLFFTPLLYHLPQSVLAAIIMMAVVGLINIKGFLHAWRAQWYDGAISVMTFVGTLVAAPHLDRGILIGVGLSLAVFIYKNMRPTVVDLSLGVDRAMHDAVTYGLAQCRFIDVVRFDGPLFFANASYLEEQIRQRRLAKKQLKHIIIAANGINDIDASGLEALSFVVDRLRRAGIDISLSRVNDAVMAALERTHLAAKIGEDHFFPTLQSAINAVHAKTHQGSHEQNCPLKTVVRVHAHQGDEES